MIPYADYFDDAFSTSVRYTSGNQNSTIGDSSEGVYPYYGELPQADPPKPKSKPVWTKLKVVSPVWVPNFKVPIRIEGRGYA